jgi:hypothetical protein
MYYPENMPLMGAIACGRPNTGPLALEGATRLACRLTTQVAIRIATQTTTETGPQVKSRVTLQQTCQVLSVEVTPVALKSSIRVPVESGSPIATRDPVEFAVRFAPQFASRTTVRTTPGTVPGAVRGVTREASLPATWKWLVLLTCYQTVSYRESPKRDEDSVTNLTFWCV